MSGLRAPKPRRGNYIDEAQSLLNLSRAVRSDDTLDVEYRSDVQTLLINAASALMHPKAASLEPKAKRIK